MARVDISQAFITFLDRASLNPLDALDQLDLDEFANLDAIDIDEPDSTSVSSTSILGRQGDVSVEFQGTGFSPVTSFEAFSAAVENGTARGTLTGIEVREGGTVVFAAALTQSTLTLTSGDRELEIAGSFPTSFADVLELIYAIEVASDEFEFVTPAELAEAEAVLARYNVSSASWQDASGMDVAFTLGDDKVDVDLSQGLSIAFNGSFTGGLESDLASLGLVASVLGAGEFYEEDGIALSDVVISGPDGTPFFTATGPFGAGEFLEDVPLYVLGQEMASFELGSGTAGQARDIITAESDQGAMMAGFGGNDELTGAAGADLILGGPGDDRLSGLAAGDTIYGGDGTDVIIGGAGNDMLIGGATDQDRRDVIYGGTGNDTIEGGYGNDELRGDAGNDVIAGGFGGDTVIGGTGNDTVTGSALGDLLFGSDGDDFINGGFGYDQMNGGAGADEFFHLGVADHGSDWIQDYVGADGDTLVFGINSATRAQFQINEAFKDNAGDADVAEAFVIYRPTGQIMWALIDGAGQDEINLRIGGETFDLMS